MNCNGQQEVLFTNGTVTLNSSALEPASKAYVDALSINDLNPQYGNYNAHTYKITSVGNATANTDLVNRQTGDARYYAVSTLIADVPVSGPISLASQKITNVATPTLSTDFANQGYVTTALDNTNITADLQALETALNDTSNTAA